ncbi:MAG TPA: hypothetical protein P5233_13900 [Candidatus Paceibacterota bacterium]|nr:hypothetical protein [Candidatus Paceibacterota bacterium]
MGNIRARKLVLTNDLVLIATDVWGNVMTTNVAVVKTSFPLTLDPVPVGQLHQRFVAVTGTIGDPNYSVWVNGRQAVVAGNTWSASQVPVTPGGVAWFEVTAYPPGENPLPDPAEPDRNPPAPNAQNVPAEVEKASAWYVVQDSQEWTMHDHFFCNYPSGMETNILDQTYTHSWTNGQGGGGGSSEYWWNSVAGMAGCARHFTWPASEWPELVAGTWQGDCAPGSGLEPPPIIGMECCAVEERVPWLAAGEMGIYDYRRNAQTRLVLFTGGRAGVRRKNLFVCSANATAVLHKGATPPYNAPWLQGWTRWIAPQTIQLGGLGQVGSDGFLYQVLPDNETLDFTPRVKNEEFYHFGINQQKHKPKIFWQFELDTTDCTNTTIVGQQMYLNFAFDPPLILPPEVTHRWSVPGDTLKRYWQFWSVTTNYCIKEQLQSSDLATNPVAFYWINSGHALQVSCTADVAGAVVLARTWFTIHRPTATLITKSSTNIPPVHIATDAEGHKALQYGENLHTPGKDGMSASMTVTAPANGGGHVGYIQMLDQTTRRRLEEDGTRWITRGGQAFDGFIGIAAFPIGSEETKELQFYDSPGQFVYYPPKVDSRWVSASDRFSLYVVYKPNEAGQGSNIWVTLRKVEWSWSGAASKDSSGAWTLDQGYPAPPVDPVSQDSVFQPTWNRIAIEIPEVPDE